MPLFRLLASTALVFALSACNNSPGTPASDSMELKIYAVPPAQTHDLSLALNKVLDKKANVTIAAPGQLLIYAPRGAQSSIGAAITNLGNTTATESVVAQMQLQFWIVDGLTGAGEDDPALNDLASTLAPLRQSMGPLHFALSQRASAVTSSNRNGSMVITGGSAYPSQIGFNASTLASDVLANGPISLQLTYQDQGSTGLSQFETQIDTRSGQYVILAQAPGACPPALPGQTASACPSKPALRLLIVRVDRLPSNA